MLQRVTAHYVAGSLDLVWMSVLHKMNTQSICSVLTNPLPQPLHYSYKQRWATRRERGMSSEDSAPAARLPAPATPPCRIYKPSSPLRLWCLPDADFFFAHDLDGKDRSLAMVSPSSRTFLKKVLKKTEMFPQLTTLWHMCENVNLWTNGSPNPVQPMAGERCGSARIKYTGTWITFSFSLSCFLINKETSSRLNVFQTYLLSWLLALHFVSCYKALLMFC